MNTVQIKSVTNNKTSKTQPCRLKGSLFTLTVLELYNDNLEKLEQHLQEKIKTAPDFFKHTPVVLDLDQFKSEQAPDFFAIQNVCRTSGLIPIAIRGGKQRFQASAQQAGFAVLPASKPLKSVKPIQPADSPEATIDSQSNISNTNTKNKTKIINHQVRSGQQIHNTQGDLIIVNSVSPGAELVADGSIHVYGTLKGRALAGVNGDPNARIFCRKLEAELISIAGHYKISDELQNHINETSLQIYLEREQLIIRPL